MNWGINNTLALTEMEMNEQRIRRNNNKNDNCLFSGNDGEGKRAQWRWWQEVDKILIFFVYFSM